MNSTIKIPDEHGFDDNPEWTREDFAKARPASQVLPAELYRALVARHSGSGQRTKR